MNTPVPFFSHSSKLDVLRILLCCCVLLCHFYPGTSHTLAGNVGVLGFFALSGYLLQASFFRMGEHLDVEKFYKSKAERLLPAYVLSFVLPVFLLLISQSRTFTVPSPDNAVCSVFDYVTYYNYAAWFMGCFIVFMLLAPALWVLHRARCGILIGFILAFGFASLCYWYYGEASFIKMGNCRMPQMRLWQFMLGMLVCRAVYSRTWRMTPSLRWGLSLCVLMILLLGGIWVSVHYELGRSLENSYWIDVACIALLSCLIALWDDGLLFSSPRFRKFVLWVASLTYGIYLFHIPLQEWVKVCGGYLFSEKMNSCTLIVVLTILVSAVLADLLNRVCAWYWSRK